MTDEQITAIWNRCKDSKDRCTAQKFARAILAVAPPVASQPEGAPACQDCGEPQSRNPHAKAGDASLEFGYLWHCIPCLVKSRSAWTSRCYAAERECERLASQAQSEGAALRDALRYRWLRAQHWDDAQLGVVRYPKASVKLGHDCPSLERLDEAIDAALFAGPVAPPTSKLNLREICDWDNPIGDDDK